MKTILIFEEIPEKVSFIVLDGDYSRFEGVYVNGTDTPELNSELLSIIFNIDTGEPNVKMLDKFPTDIVKTTYCIVIRCGFLL